MADFSRDPREHWLKPRFSKNEVANSGYTRPRFPVQQNAARHKMPRDMPWDRAWRRGKPSRGFKPPHTH